MKVIVFFCKQKTAYEMRISDWSSDVCSSDLMAQEVITLSDAMDRAMSNNLQIKQAAFQAALSEKDVLQAKMNLYPSANAGTSTNWNWGTFFDQSAGRLITTSGNSIGADFSVSAPIFQGFQRVNPKIGRASCRERVCQYV